MNSSLDQLIEDTAKEHDVPTELLREMLKMEREVLHLKVRRGLVDRLQEALQKSSEGET